MAAAAAAEVELSKDQRDIHDMIDKAVATDNGYGGVFYYNRRHGMTVALVMYVKDHPSVSLEVRSRNNLELLTQTYPFLKERVHLQWETPITSSLSLILVDDPVPENPDDSSRDPTQETLPRFLAMYIKDVPHPEHSTKFAEFEKIVNYYSTECTEEEYIVQDWFGYKSGKTVKPVCNKDRDGDN